MKTLNVKSRDFTLSITNKSGHVEIEIKQGPYIPADYDGKVIVADLFNMERDMYNTFATEYNLKECLDNWLNNEIDYIEERLAKLKFLRKISSRKKFKFLDSRGDA